VVIGNGNVALDVARMLAADPEYLARTDIADHALDALRTSNVREVIVLGRRGPADAAFSLKELLGLTRTPGLQVVTRMEELEADARWAAQTPRAIVRRKVDLLRDLAIRRSGTGRTVVLRFLATLTEVIGTDRVEAITLNRNAVVGADSAAQPAPTGETETLSCGLVVGSVGTRGTRIPGLPFDEDRGTIPHVEGRVKDPCEDVSLPGIYVTGWIKRGPSGVIGTNKQCAGETVQRLLEDFRAGRLPAPTADMPTVPDAITRDGWLQLDRHERAMGRERNRPRVKLVDRDAANAALGR
jgi:ferredoxin--NADP+ reductase